jgi:hypothetical protein
MLFETKAERFAWIKDKDGRYHGVTEASDLGFPPGEWPVALVIKGRTYDKLFFDDTLPHPATMAKANEEGHYYTSRDGSMYVHVLND